MMVLPICLTILSLFLIASTTPPVTSSTDPSLHKRSEQCYHDLGCFSSLPNLDQLPMSPEELGTQFQLYSRRNPLQPLNVNATGSDSAWTSILDRGHVVWSIAFKVVVHGYFSSGQTAWVVDLKDELLKKGDFNVIVVDWHDGAKQVPPEPVAANVFLVAAQVAKFISFLSTRSSSFRLDNVHLIGHSFGAHICGNVGSMLGGGLARITGLDPAEPYFKAFPNSKRLDKSDAVFVDIIHSDAEDFSGIQGYGLIDALGDADFYPNGGLDQPGCLDIHYTLDILAGIFNQGTKLLGCNHGRSYQVFIESVNTASAGCHFTAYPCASWDDYKAGRCRSCPTGGCPVMGYNTPTSARGKLYLSTTTTPPYCGFEYFIQMELTAHVQEDSYGRFYVSLKGDHDSEETEFSRDDVHYRAGMKETQVVAVHRRVGRVSGVGVRFQHVSGRTGRNTNSTVLLHKVQIRDSATDNSVVFCAGDFQLVDNQTHVFTTHTGC